MFDMPPPGAERDAEIARLLGWTRVNDRDTCSTWIINRERFITEWAPSTSPSHADHLVDEMVRRWWCLTVEHAPPKIALSRFRTGSVSASFHRGWQWDHEQDPIRAAGATRPDAVSAAALLALRGAA